QNRRRVSPTLWRRLFFSPSRRRHTSSVSAFLLNRSSDLHSLPTATKEIQYLNAKGALTYTDIAGDPVLYGNLPPREISMKDVFRSRSEERRVGKECRWGWSAGRLTKEIVHQRTGGQDTRR